MPENYRQELGYFEVVGMFLDCRCCLRVFILCMTDTDDVALLELQVAVLLILHLRFL